MLPLEHSWYKKLMLLALVLGAVGAVAALVFNGVTGVGMGFFFGDAGTDRWTGKWWWILLTAFGGLSISLLRRIWKQPEQIPGSIALARQGWVEPSSAVYWAIISTISLITGASLGPSFALIVMGGAFGSWLVSRLGEQDDEDASQQYTAYGYGGWSGRGLRRPIVCHSSDIRTVIDSKKQLCGRIHPPTPSGNCWICCLLQRDRQFDDGRVRTSGV